MTQGIISLVDKEGHVLRKVVAGCDGYLAPKVGQVLRAMRGPLSLEIIYEVVLEYGMGSESCLVVQGPEGSYYDEQAISDPLPDLYAEKFSNPLFNPRWASGEATFKEVVEVDWTDAVSGNKHAT